MATSSSDGSRSDAPVVTPWRMPDFETPCPAQPPQEPDIGAEAEIATVEVVPAVSEDELAEVRAEARESGYRDGFQSGYDDGKSAAAEELTESAERMRAILDHLARPLDLLDQSLEQQLAQLVALVSRKLIYRELSLNEGQIVAVVREAVGLLPVVERQITLHLNPEDAVLVREALALDVDKRPWHIVDDPLLTRGGCRVVSGPSQIDATVESRINRLVARLAGGCRQDDGEETAKDAD